MSDDKKSNIAKGRNSYDADIDGTIIPFFNRNVTPYPTEAGGPKFDLIPVTKQKDIMINHARMYAQQEYDRIMELVAVLEKQAQDIKRRLDVTDAVHAAEYQFQIVMGQSYCKIHGRSYLDGNKRIRGAEAPYITSLRRSLESPLQLHVFRRHLP
jgi:hypothetical protein